MARGVLFDKDGTLLDFEATWFPIVMDSLNSAARRFDIPPSVITDIKARSGVLESGFARESLIQGATVTNIIEQWTGTLAESGIRAEGHELKAIFYEAAASAPIRVTKGAPDLLAALKREGYRLGLVTADDRRSTEGGLRAAGLLGYFDYLATDGEGRAPKPDPASADEFRAMFGIDTGELAMFGDSFVDLEYARKAGARFIGMRTSCNGYERFTAAGYPVIDDFTDQESILRMLSRSLSYQSP
jgi:HAD superfamily hydrolase (TIGR01549 family)